MKVLNILFDDRFGGPQKRVLEVARDLEKLGVNTTVCLPNRDTGVDAFLKKYNIKVIRANISKFPKLNNWLHVIPWFYSATKDFFLFREIYEKEKPGLVHVNGAMFVQPAIAAYSKKIPIVWHLNDTVLPKKIAVLIGKFNQLIASEIVVAADAVASYYQIKNTYKVIYAPVNPDCFCKKKKNEGNKQKKIVIGTLANWNPLKGLEYFVLAIKEIKLKGNKNIKGLIAGAKLDTHKEYADKIINLIKKNNLEDTIEIVGFIDNVSAYLNELDCFVLSSVSEACPIVVLEAMASNVPVVSTNVGGVEEMLLSNIDEPAGIVVESKNYVQIANAVNEIINNNHTRNELIKNAEKNINSRFALKKCCESHFDIYMKYKLDHG